MAELDPPKQRDFAIQVIERLRSEGYEAYWAGGCVRDALLGLIPKDYDVATDARPEQVRALFGKRRTLAIGAAFGVIGVQGPRPAGLVEVTTFREDVSYSDGRHPDSVRFCTAEHDARRRDFTINGMFYDPLSDEVIDYVGGQDDLAGKTVCAIGEPRERFFEDKLRLLRAIRFAATFRFAIEESTRDAILEMADQLSVVSVERIANEMRRMLADTHRADAMRLLRETGLFEQALPELAGKIAAEEESENWHATLDVMERLETKQFSVALAALCHRYGKSTVLAIGAHWKLSNQETKDAAWIVAELPRATRAKELRWSQLQPLLVDNRIESLLDLLEATTSPENHHLARCRECLLWPEEKRNPAPLLSGDDLIGHGLRPGALFRQLLAEVRDAQLNGQIGSRQQALEMVDRQVKSEREESDG